LNQIRNSQGAQENKNEIGSHRSTLVEAKKSETKSLPSQNSSRLASIATIVSKRPDQDLLSDRPKKLMRTSDQNLGQSNRTKISTDVCPMCGNKSSGLMVFLILKMNYFKSVCRKFVGVADFSFIRLVFVASPWNHEVLFD
jgi:hypothetical protein